ncbi:aquaporin family protein [Luteipulveratus sp. YIM 133132]|uniref:Aquaporin family protein n=1 Tax=Luteipulveratus flavus TaxID=3031728 RepID=A0ABT6C1S9_9MICO|nr:MULTISPECIES: MIP/aquaporin family protein [unclassified Luteipulveratus]MDE9364684.1 aquaporin family protein [Luteipulveratus sp. YIM 133132]MDF8262844.1 aquaporin family protein [Luteipulveratus sp. YIM 133296]
MSLGSVFVSEVIGTGLLTLLGCGVVANAVLPRNNGHEGGFLMINFGWGIAVFAGVFAAYKSGAHLNPAVTLGLLANDAGTYAKGVDITVGSTLTYLAGEFVGAFLGALLCWAAYKRQFDERLVDDAVPVEAAARSARTDGRLVSDGEDQALVDEPQVETTPGAPSLGVFSTGAQIRSTPWNLVTEIIGTFVLVFVIICFGKTPSGLGPLAVALLVVGIGASLGGPTGYAINPARDLGPRIAHALLPIPHKDNNDWGYSWIPVVGPIIGGVLAGLVANMYI